MTGAAITPPNEDNTVPLEQLRFALRAAEVGTWNLDISRQLVWWDDRCKELYGFRQDDSVPYEQVLQYMHPDDRQRVDAAVQWALNPRSAGQYDVEFRTIGAEDGRLRWLRCRGQAYFDGQGVAYRFSGIAQDISADKRKDQVLKSVEQRFQRAFDNASLGIVITSSEGDLLLINQAYSQMTGYSIEELYDKSYRQLTHPDDLPNNMQLIEQLKRGEVASFNLDKRYVRKDGSVFWVRFNVTRLVGEDGKTDSLIGICQDITTEIKSREAIEASNIRFRNLVMDSPTATVVYTGREMRVQAVNQPMLKVWGKDDSVVGKTLHEALPELVGQPFLELLQGVFDTGEAYHNPEGRADLVVDGRLQTFWFNFSYNPLYDEDGAVYGVINTATNITQQVITRQQYQRAEQLLQQAVDLAELGTWQINVVTQQATLSDRIRTWLGMDEQVGMSTVMQAIVPADVEQVEKAFRQAHQPGSTGYIDVEYHIANILTERRYLMHLVGQTEFDDQGNPLSINGFSQDITRQRELQLTLEQLVQQRTEELAAVNKELASTNEELAASNEEYATLNDDLAEANALLIRSNDNLQQFAYIASHDLQEPLRKIQSFGDVLLKQTATPLDGDGRFMLQRMVDAGARMSTLVSDLLAFSRISSRQDIFIPVPLQKVLDNVLDTLDLAIEQSRTRIQVQPLPVVNGDKGQLGQLFQNLISNAIKFTLAGQTPVIQVTYAELDRAELPSQVRITSNAPRFHQVNVSDEGIGFDTKYLDRIFQVFQRLHGKSQYPGTGIGLAICQRVAENHGGGISASSTPGKGATFSVYLPV